MKSIALLSVAAILTVSGCTGYRPSKANCFSFVTREATDPDCTFTPLGGAALSFVPLSEAGPSGALYD